MEKDPNPTTKPRASELGILWAIFCESFSGGIVQTDLRLTFLWVMTLIVTLPFLVWRLGRTDAYAPLVVVQIIVGILLGPGVFGRIEPQIFSSLFNPQVIQLLKGIAWWGVMSFVMLTGLELDLGASLRHRKEALVTAGFALILPFTLCVLVAVPLSGRVGWVGASAEKWQFIAGVGMACSVTALPILALFLEKLGIRRLPLGQRVLRYASLDDVAIWSILAFVLMDWARLASQLGFLLSLIPGGILVRRWLPRLPGADRWYVAVIWFSACAFASDYAGLHFTVGAFLAGVILDANWFDRNAIEQLRSQTLLLLMPVFFLLTGLQTEWGLDGWEVFAVAGLLLVASVSGKLLGVYAAGRVLGWKPGEAGVIGWLLQTKALIMILFASVLLDHGIITAAAFSALLLVALSSTMLSVPMIGIFGRKALEEAKGSRSKFALNP